jgi:hypothetical protein
MSEINVITEKDEHGLSYGVQELRVNTRGHRALHSKIERVEEPGFEDGWYKDYYYVEWTPLTAMFHVSYMDDEFMHMSALGLSHSCGQCDEWMKYDLIDGVAVAQSDCQYTEGITTVVEIDVPSGRLVCDDSLRDAEGFDWNDEDEKKMASYNTMLGQAQVVELLATRGLAFVPCGNSCPGMWEIEPGKYKVANAGYDEKTDEELTPEFGGKRLNSFCTDLWAASMADYDNFLARGGKPVEDDNQYGTRWVMDVPAGRYRLTYHVGEKDFDRDAYSKPVVFADFERIGDC